MWASTIQVTQWFSRYYRYNNILHQPLEHKRDFPCRFVRKWKMHKLECRLKEDFCCLVVFTRIKMKCLLQGLVAWVWGVFLCSGTEQKQVSSYCISFSTDLILHWILLSSLLVKEPNHTEVVKTGSGPDSWSNSSCGRNWISSTVKTFARHFWQYI